MVQKSALQKWRFSSGWRLASIRASVMCYVWSNNRRGLQHCPGGAQSFPRRLTQFLGKPNTTRAFILRS
ncbi:hypothetical protein G6F46_015136 [Rhizopus delemar]|nr:hypothetical protein G6F46_015136 [Rhizopus delemar]